MVYSFLSQTKIKMAGDLTLLYITILTYSKLLNIINLIYLYLGRTSLMEAAVRGKTDVVKILLENGADINAKDNDG